MNNNFQTADILHFAEYVFTDTNQKARHFALVLLPSKIMEFESNLLCAVITSKFTREFALKLLKSKYAFFSKDSYVCLNRRDINCLEGLSDSKQPVGKLDILDIRKAFKILKSILYGTSDIYLMATIVKEWKKIK
ncbi:MAG: hypothetical protein A2Y67_01670 [Candidatus Buchananbacteria bacterium RBG_13_39_9]|uniref:Uncharacterized protein n=1 Tax=Candidatus Buchananbacteria bacterium RBG_13_39_9 TaxID=1797531 RepID=A0A1G1XQB8_9BACT|nr:MAG: hypothetical protein A2Y67_01670 [Candidatus Buchananbacteria bacterium RBG_13_39_9]